MGLNMLYGIFGVKCYNLGKWFFFWGLVMLICVFVNMLWRMKEVESKYVFIFV